MQRKSDAKYEPMVGRSHNCYPYASRSLAFEVSEMLRGNLSQSDFDKRLSAWIEDRKMRDIDDDEKENTEIDEEELYRNLPTSARHILDITWKALGEPHISVLSDQPWIDEAQRNSKMRLVPFIDIEQKLRSLHSMEDFVYDVYISGGILSFHVLYLYRLDE